MPNPWSQKEHLPSVECGFPMGSMVGPLSSENEHCLQKIMVMGS